MPHWIRRLWDNSDILKRPWCWVVGHNWEANASFVAPSTDNKIVPLRFCWRCTKGFRLS